MKTIQHAGGYLCQKAKQTTCTSASCYKRRLLRKKDEFPVWYYRWQADDRRHWRRQSLLEKSSIKLSSYDERFIIGGGDVDLCIRLNKMGYQTWYVSGGYILHKESQSREQISIPYSDFYWSYFKAILPATT